MTDQDDSAAMLDVLRNLATQLCGTMQMDLNDEWHWRNLPAQLTEFLQEDDELRARLSALLTGVANGLKGQPAPLRHHDWSDLPALACGMAGQLHAIKVHAGPLHDWFGKLLVAYADTNGNQSMPNNQILMGGGDACVTAGDLRVLLAAISHVSKGMYTGDSALPDQAEALRQEVSDLHRQLAHATLRADQGWQRYESANKDRIALQAERAELMSVWHAPAKLHATLLKSSYPRDLALHLAGATDYDTLRAALVDMAAQLGAPVQYVLAWDWAAMALPSRLAELVAKFGGATDIDDDMASELLGPDESRRAMATLLALSPLRTVPRIDDGLGEHPLDAPTESSSEQATKRGAGGGPAMTDRYDQRP